MEMLLAYLALGGPFLVVALDLIMARSTHQRVDWLPLLLAIGGMVVVPLLFARSGAYSLYVMLLLGIVLLTHSGRMRGLGQFIAFFGWMMLIGLAIGQLAPQMRLAEAGYLPANIGFFLIPPLLLWHLWSVLPLVYDALRGGNWVEQGVPLRARYALLSVIALASLATACYFGWQWNEQRRIFAQEASQELYSMWYELKMADQLLTPPDMRSYPDWREEVAERVRSYQRAISRVTTFLRLKSEDSQFRFLSADIPGRFLEIADYQLSLSEDDIQAFSVVLKASVEALEAAVNSGRPFSPETYRVAADRILEQLKGTEALSWLSTQRHTP